MIWTGPRRPSRFYPRNTVSRLPLFWSGATLSHVRGSGIFLLRLLVITWGESHKSRSDINQPSTHHTHTIIYNPRRQTSRLIFLCQKVAHFGAAILTINDFSISHRHGAHGHTLTHTHIYKYIPHTTHPTCPCPPLPASHLPTKPLLPHVSISSQLVSRSKARYPLYSDGSIVFLCFSCSKVQAKGEAKYPFLLFSLFSIYLHAHAHIYIYTLSP